MNRLVGRKVSIVSPKVQVRTCRQPLNIPLLAWPCRAVVTARCVTAWPPLPPLPPLPPPCVVDPRCCERLVLTTPNAVSLARPRGSECSGSPPSATSRYHWHYYIRVIAGSALGDTSARRPCLAPANSHHIKCTISYTEPLMPPPMDTPPHPTIAVAIFISAGRPRLCISTRRVLSPTPPAAR